MFSSGEEKFVASSVIVGVYDLVDPAVSRHGLCKIREIHRLVAGGQSFIEIDVIGWLEVPEIHGVRLGPSIVDVLGLELPIVEPVTC